MINERIAGFVRRIADALDRLSPPDPPPPDLNAADAFVWRAEGEQLEPVAVVNRLDLALLKGIDRQASTLLDLLTRRAGMPQQQLFTVAQGANNPRQSNDSAAGRAAV